MGALLNKITHNKKLKIGIFVKKSKLFNSSYKSN